MVYGFVHGFIFVWCMVISLLVSTFLIKTFWILCYCKVNVSLKEWDLELS